MPSPHPCTSPPPLNDLPDKSRRSTAFKLAVGIGTVVGALAIGELSGWPFLRAPVESRLNQMFAVPVTLEGRFRTRLIVNPHLAVERITVGAGGGVEVPHLLQARNFDVRWRWTDLWRARQGKTLRIRSLQASHIDVHAVRHSSGEASWNVVPPSSGPAISGRAPAPMPEIERLVLQQGDVAFKDDLLKITLQAHIQQANDRADTLPWKAEARGLYRGAPVKLTAQASADLPLLLQSDSNPPLMPINLSGQIGSTMFAFDGVAGALWAGQGVNGQLKVSGESLQESAAPLGVTLPATPPYSIDAHVVRQGARWFVVTDSAKVGSSELLVSMVFDTAATPPRLSGRLGGKRLALADLGPAVGANQPPHTRGRVLPDEPFNLPRLNQMDANVVIDLHQLDFGTPNLAPVRNLKGHLTLQNNRLAITDLSARLAGGEVSGSTSLAVGGEVPQWEAALRLAQVDLDTWIRGLSRGAAQAKNGPQPDPRSYMSGTMGASANLKGHGSSVAEILGNANGRLQVQVSDGKISQLVTEAAGLDVAQALGMLIQGDKSLKLRCAAVDAVVTGGVVKSRNAVLDNADSTLRLQGGASFKTEALHLRLVSEPKDFSPLSLRSPVTVTGSFAQPTLGIESKGLITRIAGALALGSVAPPAALLAFMDTGSGEDFAPCTAQMATKAH
jgi:AsmA family protein